MFGCISAFTIAASRFDTSEKRNLYTKSVLETIVVLVLITLSSNEEGSGESSLLAYTKL